MVQQVTKNIYIIVFMRDIDWKVDFLFFFSEFL